MSVKVFFIDIFCKHKLNRLYLGQAAGEAEKTKLIN